MIAIYCLINPLLLLHLWCLEFSDPTEKCQQLTSYVQMLSFIRAGPQRGLQVHYHPLEICCASTWAGNITSSFKTLKQPLALLLPLFLLSRVLHQEPLSAPQNRSLPPTAHHCSSYCISMQACCTCENEIEANASHLHSFPRASRAHCGSGASSEGSPAAGTWARGSLMLIPALHVWDITADSMGLSAVREWKHQCCSDYYSFPFIWR